MPLEVDRLAYVEHHEARFDEFRFDVSVGEDGKVWVSFHEASKCAFSCSLTDLEECVRFALKHAVEEVAS